VALALLIGTGCGPQDPASASSGDAATSDAGAAEAAAKDGDETGEKGKDAEKGEEEKKKEEAVPVEVVALARGPIESVLRLSSNLEAERGVEVYAQAKRRVTRLAVEEGHRVAKGAILLELEDDEQQSALSKVQARLTKAEREYERQQRLYEQQLISEQVYRDATFEVEQLRLELADAERELGYTEVRAPIAGTVTSRLVNLGDTVQIGQHLFDIVDFDSIVALVYVPEKNLAALRPGLEARVVAAVSGAAHSHTARIERIAPVVDPRSGTVKVTVDVGQRPGLRPGMYVDVDLVLERRTDALLVPKRALVHDDDQMYVYRLGEEHRVSRVFFAPRLSDKHHVEPDGGLAAGDRIVVAGQAGLKDGALVSVAGEPAPVDPERTADGQAAAADDRADS
jgi:membrane fusion protein (multidrug efflux system)